MLNLKKEHGLDEVNYIYKYDDFKDVKLKLYIKFKRNSEITNSYFASYPCGASDIYGKEKEDRRTVDIATNSESDRYFSIGPSFGCKLNGKISLFLAKKARLYVNDKSIKDINVYVED